MHHRANGARDNSPIPYVGDAFLIPTSLIIKIWDVKREQAYK